MPNVTGIRHFVIVCVKEVLVICFEETLAFGIVKWHPFKLAARTNQNKLQEAFLSIGEYTGLMQPAAFAVRQLSRD
jgi:hypothetical protein